MHNLSVMLVENIKHSYHTVYLQNMMKSKNVSGVLAIPDIWRVCIGGKYTLVFRIVVLTAYVFGQSFHLCTLHHMKTLRFKRYLITSLPKSIEGDS